MLKRAASPESKPARTQWPDRYGPGQESSSPEDGFCGAVPCCAAAGPALFYVLGFQDKMYDF